MPAKPRILISAGHTSMDPGAIFQDLREADLNRNIAKKVLNHLQKAKNVEVQAVPLDLPLFQRLEWINNTGYTKENNDVLVEIHVNDADGSKRGVEAWYEGNGDNASQKLCALLVDHLTEEFKWESQGAKSEYDHELGMLTFLNRSNPAAAIVEILYMDNPEDQKILRDEEKLDKIAASVATATLKYFGKDAKGKDLDDKDKPDLEAIAKKQVKSEPGKKKRSLFDLPSLGAGGSDSDDDEDDDFGFGGLGSFGNSDSGGLFGNKNNNNPLQTAKKDSGPKPPSAPTKPSTGFGGGLSSGLGNGGSMMMDREERKKMIEDYYLKILGRKPQQSDLNYFLNRGTSEQELIKKMVESQEHVDLVKSKKELNELQEKHKKLENDSERLKASVRDMRGILDNLNRLILHKNKQIRELETLVHKEHGKTSAAYKLEQQKPESSQKPLTEFRETMDFALKPVEKLFMSIVKRFS